MRRFRAIGAIAISAGLGAVALALSGCNIVGPVGYFIAGPPKVQARHELDPKRATVMFIDDRANRLPRRALRGTIAERAQKALLDKGTVKNLIDARAAFAAAARESDAEPLSITDIGRNAKAEVVIYVTIDAFSLTPDGQTFQPSTTMRVKVMDATNDTRLWPEDPAGFRLIASPEVRQGFVPRSQADVSKAQIEAAETAGLAVAQLFFTHEGDATKIGPTGDAASR